jgi:nucleoside-diphosphate-sugar epimerase
LTTAWAAGPTDFRPSDMRTSTWARGFGRSVAELDPNNHEPLEIHGRIAARPARGGTLITGGSGFLGARIVRQLLDGDGRQSVYVASRRPGALTESLRRMVGTVETLRYMLDERLVMIPVDMSGDDACGAVLRHVGSSRIRTVVHLAAAVDAFAPRERLAPANETATRNAIAVAAAKGARLVHASTLSVFVSSDMDGEDEETSLRNRPDRMLFGGYAQSKAVADMLVEDALAAGVDACSVRLGLLVPEDASGMEPKSFLRVFHDALVEVGSVPATCEEALIDLTPVDQAAAAMLVVAEADEVPVFVHYANPTSGSLSQLTSAILGHAPMVVDDEEWNRRRESLPSIARTVLQAAFNKSRFLSSRCTTLPVANADLFQSTARKYDVSTAVAIGAPMPRSPAVTSATLFGKHDTGIMSSNQIGMPGSMNGHGGKIR